MFAGKYKSLPKSISPERGFTRVGSGREYQRGKYHCTVDLLFDWFGLVCFANKNKNCYTADSKPVKQEVNGTVIFPPLVFPGSGLTNKH